MDLNLMFQQYVVPLFKWIEALLTPAEWSAVFLLLLGTLVATHILKMLWRISPLKGDRRHALINLSAVIVGTLLGSVLWPDKGHAPWWFAGFVFGGGGSIATWKMAWPIFATVFPSVASKVNLERRRSDNPVPPDGVAERRKAP